MSTNVSQPGVDQCESARSRPMSVGEGPDQQSESTRSGPMRGSKVTTDVNWGPDQCEAAKSRRM